MARKAFVLVAGLCISFMGAAAMILSTEDDKPGEKQRGIVQQPK